MVLFMRFPLSSSSSSSIMTSSSSSSSSSSSLSWSLSCRLLEYKREWDRFNWEGSGCCLWIDPNFSWSIFVTNPNSTNVKPAVSAIRFIAFWVNKRCLWFVMMPCRWPFHVPRTPLLEIKLKGIARRGAWWEECNRYGLRRVVAFPSSSFTSLLISPGWWRSSSSSLISYSFFNREYRECCFRAGSIFFSLSTRMVANFGYVAVEGLIQFLSVATWISSAPRELKLCSLQNRLKSTPRRLPWCVQRIWGFVRQRSWRWYRIAQNTWTAFLQWGAEQVTVQPGRLQR